MVTTPLASAAGATRRQRPFDLSPPTPEHPEAAGPAVRWSVREHRRSRSAGRGSGQTARAIFPQPLWLSWTPAFGCSTSTGKMTRTQQATRQRGAVRGHQVTREAGSETPLPVFLDSMLICPWRMAGLKRSSPTMRGGRVRAWAVVLDGPGRGRPAGGAPTERSQAHLGCGCVARHDATAALPARAALLSYPKSHMLLRRPKSRIGHRTFSMRER